MLGRLFSSRIRVEILALLLNNPDQGFYLREIARLINKNAAGVKRELDNLYKMNVLLVRREGNQKHFSADMGSYLYPELRSLLVKALGTEGTLKSVFQAATEVRAAFLFGAYLADRDNPEIDILLVGEMSPELERKLGETGDMLGRSIRPWAIPYEVYRDWMGRGDGRLSAAIQGRRLFLKGGP
ncbi:MAG: winged helix-turn-helix transcriptional regulator [Nitrospirae bacterium]|nr:winged helix-turn-helix transcriptional regulator [Nitrospirota bacterium]